MYLKRGQDITVKHGKTTATGKVGAIDIEQGKLVSFAFEVDEPPYGPQSYHKRVEDIVG